MNKCVLGIDPGQNGAACLLGGNTMQIIKHCDGGLVSFIRRLALPGTKAFIENISTNKCGLSNLNSMRLISQDFGWWMGLLDMAEVPYETVSSSTFESVCGCKLKKYNYTEQKEANFQAAKRLYPAFSFPKYAADAILIAHFGTLRT